MSEFEVGVAEDLQEGRMKRAKANEVDILVAKVGGKLYAIGDTCTHRGCSLSTGWLNGYRVTCACHLSQFDIKDGRVLRGPAVEPTPSFEVRVEAERVVVKL